MNIEYEKKKNQIRYDNETIINELNEYKNQNNKLVTLNTKNNIKKGSRNESDHQNNLNDKVNTVVEPIRLDNLKIKSAKKLDICGIEVLFPYQPYECQVTYMEYILNALKEMKNALLQSPTGTGKTLCLLCSTLAWLKNHRESLANNPLSPEKEGNSRIIYLSRTHSQLKQIVKELKNTCYRPIMSVFGSRDQLCVKPELKGLTGIALTASCKKARISQIPEFKCQHYENLMRSESGFLNKFQSKMVDLEELTDLGHMNTICPYFYQRKLQHRADIIFMPYNYLLDGRIRDIMDIKIENSIIIFDEAHNIESVCEEGVSFELSLKDLENCENDEKLLRKALSENAEECKITGNDIDNVMQPIYAFKRSMIEWKKEMDSKIFNRNQIQPPQFADSDKGEIFPGQMIFTIFKEKTKTQKTNIKQLHLKKDQNFQKFNNGLNETTFSDYLTLIQNTCEELSSITSSKGGLNHFCFCTLTVSSLLKQDNLIKLEGNNQDWLRNKINSYVVYVHNDRDDPANFTLSFWCLNPGIGFSQITELNPRSIILTSGTLAPLKSFESELMTDFHYQLLNKHVIDTKKQVYTVVLRKGCSGHPFNFSYENRNSLDMLIEAGNTLTQSIPNGILVFFASYFLMQKCMELWDNPEYSILSRLNNLKVTYQEPRNSNHMKTVMNEYISDAKKKGAILFAVCRGKASEGIDFADEMARGVVLIGVPYPATTDKRVDLKKKFLTDSKMRGRKIGGNEWYFQQTARAVNQAVGRSIRHINDYGAVILMDERYSGKDFVSEYPGWIKDNFENIDKIGLLIPKLSTFFKDRRTPAALKQILANRLNMNENNNSNNLTNLPIPPIKNFLNPASKILPSNQQMFSQSFKPNIELFKPNVKSIPQESNSIIMLCDSRTDKAGNDCRGPNDKHTQKIQLNMPNNPKNTKNDGPDDLKINGNKGIISSIQQILPKEKIKQPVSPSQIVDPKPKKRKAPEPLMIALKRKKVDEEQAQKSAEFLQHFTQTYEELDNPSKDQVSPFVTVTKDSENKDPSNLQGKSRLLLNKTLIDDILQGDNAKKGLIVLDEEDKETLRSQSNDDQKYEDSNPNAITCMVCYDTMTEGKIFETSPCGHTACQSCWSIWLKKKLECPMCKCRVRPKKLDRLK